MGMGVSETRPLDMVRSTPLLLHMPRSRSQPHPVNVIDGPLKRARPDLPVRVMRNWPGRDPICRIPVGPVTEFDREPAACKGP